MGFMSEAHQDAKSVDIDLQLRWSDEDALGHVNNARVVTLMEEARLRWTQPRSNSGRFQYGTVVASMKVDYLRPLYYQPNMIVRLSVVRIGTKSFTLRHVGIQDGEPIFDGTSIMVPLAEDGKSSRAINELERAWLESAFVASDA